MLEILLKYLNTKNEKYLSEFLKLVEVEIISRLMYMINHDDQEDIKQELLIETLKMISNLKNLIKDVSDMKLSDNLIVTINKIRKYNKMNNLNINRLIKTMDDIEINNYIDSVLNYLDSYVYLKHFIKDKINKLKFLNVLVDTNTYYEFQEIYYNFICGIKLRKYIRIALNRKKIRILKELKNNIHVSIDTIYNAKQNDNVLIEHEYSYTKSEFNEYLEGLNDIEKNIIIQYYYFKSSEKDIATNIKLSQQYISKIKHIALNKIKHNIF